MPDADRTAAMEILPSVARRAREIGYTRAGLVVLPFHETLPTAASFTDYVRRRDGVLEILDDHGIALALEYTPQAERYPAMDNQPVKLAGGEALEFDWGRIVWLVSGSLGNSGTMTFGRVTIRAGHSNPRHRHPNCDEVLHLLSGRLEHTLGDARFVMEPGDTISIPTGAWHNARALGDKDADMTISFSSPDRQTQGEDAL